MKLSNSFFYTLREDAKDEESRSGNLLVRSGMIKRVGSGMYMFLPMGLRVLDNLRKIAYLHYLFPFLKYKYYIPFACLPP